MVKTGSISLAAALCMLAAGTPAMADVKAGVEAWSAGDYARAVKEWQPAADKGDADAQYNLGQAYMTGRGVLQDTAKAQDYYARAAEQGHMQAADNYGLLLFQGGRREEALPYIQDAAARGDPRAQYLLGIGHFNGDIVAKDWVRAYALVSLANGQGLPQAPPAIAQMDKYIPVEQRQAAAGLAAEMQAQADQTRAQQIAAANLAMGKETPKVPRKLAQAEVPASIAAPGIAMAQARKATGQENPAHAGADYARPAPSAPAAVAAPRPAPKPAPAPASKPAPAAMAKPAPKPAAASGGPWKVQLGAFGVAGNAEKLWSQIGGKGPLAGTTRILQPAGSLTKLLAGGFASQSDAADACAALKRSGQGCLVTR